MFLPFWLLSIVAVTIIILLMNVFGLAKKVRRLKRIIRRLEAVEEKRHRYSESGDVEGHA